MTTKIIGLIGKAGAGKSTLASCLTSARNRVELAFADPIRQILGLLTGVYGVEDKNEPLPVINASYREFCTKFGTDFMRNEFDDAIWVNHLHMRVQGAIDAGMKVIIVSDVRYHNEADLIIALGGELWEIQRDGLTAVDHESERTDWSQYPKRFIRNNTDLVDLCSAGETALKVYGVDKAALAALIDDVKSYAAVDNPTLCSCDHKISGTGAIFYQGVGLLECANCRGWQRIRKPVK